MDLLIRRPVEVHHVGVAAALVEERLHEIDGLAGALGLPSLRPICGLVSGRPRSGIASRLELAGPDEPRHAGVDRFVEQMLECAPKLARRRPARWRTSPSIVVVVGRIVRVRRQASTNRCVSGRWWLHGRCALAGTRWRGTPAAVAGEGTADDPAQCAGNRRRHGDECWQAGTVAAQLGVHGGTVHAAVVEHESGGVGRGVCRSGAADLYRAFIGAALTERPRLSILRHDELVRRRGRPGSVVRIQRRVEHPRLESGRGVHCQMVIL